MPADTMHLPGTHAEIAALVPHQGLMCVLESVGSWTPEAVVCRTRSHASPDSPLRRDGRLAAICLCEYGAQAAAVHGALSARGVRTAAGPALLVALRDVRLLVAEVSPSGTLDVGARLVHSSESGRQYEFTVHRGGRLLASGRVTVMLQRNASCGEH